MKKTMAVLLAFVITIAFMPATIPATAAHSDAIIDLSGFSTGADIPVAAYTNWSYTAVSRTFNITNHVTVTGASTANGTFTFNIPGSVNVTWEATYTGSSGTLIDLTGEGTFDVVAGKIENTGSGTTVRARGGDAKNLILVSGGTVAANSGNAILVESVTDSNNIITGPATAKVTVSGGKVYNFANNNVRPAIQMNNPNDTSLNVTVTGTGLVSASQESGNGFAIQTYGNVLVSGGTVSATNGRAINLVGLASNATITGGAVYVTGDSASSAAISTATTAGVDVTNAKVVVSGGLVYANNGMAIRTTGKNSTVTVSGGTVIAYGTGITGNGNVIYTQNNTINGFTPANVTLTGVVVAWNHGVNLNISEYEEGTTTHIIKLPAGATAEWAHNTNPSGKDGIKITPVSGVPMLLGFGDDLIGFAPVTVSSTPPSLVEYTVFVTIQGDTLGTVSASGQNPINAYSWYIPVPEGGNLTITITPNSPNRIVSVRVNDVTDVDLTYNTFSRVYSTDTYVLLDNMTLPVTSANTYTLNNVTSNRQLHVEFGTSIPGYSIMYFSDEGGSISPQEGIRWVGSGGNQSFTVTPDSGYIINEVTVNGSSVPVADATNAFTHTLQSVTTHLFVIATFERSMRHIDVSHNFGGSVMLGGSAAASHEWVSYGDAVTFEIAVDSGYRVSSIVVDGNSISTASFPYIQFPYVDGDHNVVVTFALIQTPAADVEQEPYVKPEPEPDPKPPSPFIKEHYAYITGYPNGTVRPERSITRAEVATIFYRLLTDEVWEKTRNARNPFPDVNPESWYGAAVSAIAGMEIVTGYPDGTFKPDRKITRAEITTIVARFARQMKMSAVNSANASDIAGHWAEGDIIYIMKTGWMQGYTDSTFRPDLNMTRAEFITLVNRILERAPETADDLATDDMVRWDDNADPDAWYYLAVQEATNSHKPEYKDKTVPGMDFNYEYWTEMLVTPDWSLIG